MKRRPDGFSGYKINLMLLMSLLLLNVELMGQSPGVRMDVPVSDLAGNQYPFALAGGLNHPQISQADFNGDGWDDLFVYDKFSEMPLIFERSGVPGSEEYKFRPEWLSVLPPGIGDWILMKDFDNDGWPDIFTYSTTPGVAGVEVYKGKSGSGGLVEFEKFKFWDYSFDILNFPTASGPLNLYVSRVDIPAIDDADDDGDLDVLTFNLVGNKLEYYKNMSVENGWGLDSLVFTWQDDCWGHFVEDGLSSDIILTVNPGLCADENFHPGSGPGTVRHAGSCIGILDTNGDGDTEVFLGDISNSHLVYLENDGTADESLVTVQDPTYPSYDLPVTLDVFLAPFFLDLNDDGKKEMLVCPNKDGNLQTHDMIWRYDNIALGDGAEFSFVQNDFLVGDMVDLGSAVSPVFFDYNADGLEDIVVGTYGFYNPAGFTDGRLMVFENVGTGGAPAFRLVDEDWLGMSIYPEFDFAPAFGDLDGDGDEDLVIGHNDGGVFYAENTAGPDNVPTFPSITPNYKDISYSNATTPDIADMDGDGLMDLVLGSKQSFISFFRNIGTVGNPDFAPNMTDADNIQQMGGVSASGSIIGYSTPTVFLEEGELKMLAGNEEGQVRVYDNIAGNLSGMFNEVTQNYGDLRVGPQTHVDLADIDDDGYFEMIVGNVRGGIELYQTDFLSGVTSTQDPLVDLWEVSILQNPVTDVLNLTSNQDIDDLRIVNALGQIISPEGEWDTGLQVGDLSAGVYFLQVESKGVTRTLKFLKR